MPNLHTPWPADTSEKQNPANHPAQCLASEGFREFRSCPQDCIGAYGEFGECSKKCGGGTKIKTFHVTTPASVKGEHTFAGEPCTSSHHSWYQRDGSGGVMSDGRMSGGSTKHLRLEVDQGPITEPCNVEECIAEGLVLAVWDNVNGLKSAWHAADGSLKHSMPGADLTTSPESHDTAPTTRCKLNSFEAPVDHVSDGGERVSGFFTPPSDGEYTFSLSADDGGKLYFGHNADSAAPIATVGSFLGEPGLDNGDSTPESTRKYFDEATGREIGAVSEPRTLVGGTRYYISAVEVNRQGRDALSVSVAGGPWSANHPVPIPASHHGVTVLSHSNADGDVEECA